MGHKTHPSIRESISSSRSPMHKQDEVFEELQGLNEGEESTDDEEENNIDVQKFTSTDHYTPGKSQDDLCCTNRAMKPCFTEICTVICNSFCFVYVQGYIYYIYVYSCT